MCLQDKVEQSQNLPEVIPKKPGRRGRPSKAALAAAAAALAAAAASTEGSGEETSNEINEVAVEEFSPSSVFIVLFKCLRRKVEPSHESLQPFIVFPLR